MHIAVVVSEFPGLSITFIVDQICALLDLGHTVDIYATKRGNTRKVHPAVEQYGLLGRTSFAPTLPSNRVVRMIRACRFLAAHPLTNPRGRVWALNVFKHGREALTLTLLYKVMPFLPERKYDIIHCHFGYTGVRALVAVKAGILHGRMITTFHGADVNVFPRKSGEAVYNELFERCALFTANSAFTAGRAATLGCPAEKIVKLPVGVDLRRFSFRERRLEPNEELRILTVANLVEVKGIEYGVRAVAKIRARHPNVRYQIVGDGPLLGALKELARSLEVADRVEFLGGQTHAEVGRLYEQAHLFMLPGVVGRDGAEEAQGLVLAEAQAVGLPVVSTLVGGVPESVVNGESGFLVPQRDVDALSERLSYLIEHAGLWPAMGTAGRMFVEENFDAATLNGRLIQLYQELLHQG